MRPTRQPAASLEEMEQTLANLVISGLIDEAFRKKEQTIASDELVKLEIIEKIELKITELSASVGYLYQLVTKLVGVNEIFATSLSKKRFL